jgi:hypothetical protein
MIMVRQGPTYVYIWGQKCTQQPSRQPEVYSVQRNVRANQAVMHTGLYYQGHMPSVEMEPYQQGCYGFCKARECKKDATYLILLKALEHRRRFAASNDLILSDL